MICREKVFGCISGILNQNGIFVFAKKKLQTMVTRAIYTSLFSWHSFFLKRYYTHKKVSLLSVSVSVPW
jgi:hypothetical protein